MIYVYGIVVWSSGINKINSPQEQTAASGTASDQLAEVARRLQATSTELDLVKQEKTSLVEEIHHSTLQMHTIQEKVTSLSMEIDEGKLALSSEKAEVQRLKHLEVVCLLLLVSVTSINQSKVNN